MEEPTEEYVRFSRDLGINKIPLRLVELARIVREETPGLYPYEDVVRYLDKQVEKLANNRSNRWHSLYGWRWHPAKEYPSSRGYDAPFDSRIYNKPIPPEVLPMIARIVDRFPDAEFYVTDTQEFKDPFPGRDSTGVGHLVCDRTLG